MQFGVHTYRVLLVSSSEKFFSAMRPLFSNGMFESVETAASVSAAKRAVMDKKYDFIIVNSPLTDEPGVKFVIDQSNDRDTVCLLLVKNDHYSEVNERVTEYGVFTLQKPISAAMLEQGIAWLVAARERLRKLEKKNISIQEKMEEIRFVNRAKWILIDQLKMTEPEAHRFIEKQAMDRCVPKRRIAEEIFSLYDPV